MLLATLMFTDPTQLFVANTFCHYTMTYEVILRSELGEIEVMIHNWEDFDLS